MNDTTSADPRQPIRVLFVCTGNSARSIMAESLLRKQGGGAFEVYSAGTVPRGINPLTVRVLEEAGLPTSGLSSKSVNQFLGEHFDYVITVCDQARQVCPVFPGSHQSLHWGYEDPAEATGPEEQRLRVFRSVFKQLSIRITQFVPIARRAASGEPVALG
jgi:arsenate reductase